MQKILVIIILVQLTYGLGIIPPYEEPDVYPNDEPMSEIANSTPNSIVNSTTSQSKILPGNYTSNATSDDLVFPWPNMKANQTILEANRTSAYDTTIEIELQTMLRAILEWLRLMKDRTVIIKGGQLTIIGVVAMGIFGVSMSLACCVRRKKNYEVRHATYRSKPVSEKTSY